MVVIVGTCAELVVSGKATLGDGDVPVTGAAMVSVVAVSVGAVTSAVGAVGWITVLVCVAETGAGS
jgi:hypothetical protein